jgi:copper transport outer membrane protein MctB
VIDFRYHLVSIVAVFLALGLGLLVGSTALQPYVLKGLERTSRADKARIDQLLANQAQNQAQISADQAFGQAAAHELLANLLTGQRVVVVTGPGASGPVTSGVTQMLQQDAGATVTGQVQLQQGLFDASPNTRAQLGLLAQRFALPGMTLNQAVTPLTQASQVIAGSLVVKDTPGDPVAAQRDSASAAALNGFAAEGFLTDSGQPGERANLAVVVIPSNPQSGSGASLVSEGLITFAQQLESAGMGTVVAGPVSGSGPGSAIDVMRTGGRSGKLSSVDDADYLIGQVMVAQALARQMNGVSGNYGAANGSAPSPAPTPSPTATPATTTKSHKAARPGRSS